MELDRTASLTRKYNNIYPRINHIRGTSFLLRNLKSLAISRNIKKDDNGPYFEINSEKIYLESKKDFWPIISEIDVINQFIDYLDEDKTFADIGAYQGTYSLIASKFVEDIHAFEMSPENFQKLERNIELNSAGNITTVNKAVWKHNGVVEADVEESGRSQVSSTGSQVECITLKDYFEDQTPPDIIKMDVEGAEFEILSSSIDVLTEWRPVMIIEVHQKSKIENFDHNSSDVLELLDENGFEVKKIHERDEDFHILVK